MPRVLKADWDKMNRVGRLTAAVAFSGGRPNEKQHEGYPFRPVDAKSIDIAFDLEALKRKLKEEEEAAAAAAGPVVRRIDQLDMEGNVVKTFSSLAEASGETLVPAIRIKAAADSESAEPTGGFRWRYSEEPNTARTRARGRRFYSKLYHHDNPPTFKNGNTLRDYQIDGLNWLLTSYYKKSGSILADEMGLGKTVQIVTTIDHLGRVEGLGPFLVVVPLSTIQHWEREFKAWSDINVCIYHEQKREWRNVLREVRVRRATRRCCV